MELDGIVVTDAEGVRWPDSRSYEAVGRLLLDQSDIIIALWDGRSSRGRGGTAQVISEALQRGIPVVSISWEQASEWELHEPPWRLLQSTEDQKGDFDRLSEQVVELLKRRSILVSIRMNRTICGRRISRKNIRNAGTRCWVGGRCFETCCRVRHSNRTGCANGWHQDRSALRNLRPWRKRSGTMPGNRCWTSVLQ